MSAGLPTEPVKWRPPTGPILRGQAFASNTPPFFPFPDVTQVAKGYCPVAIFHDLFWGKAYLGRRDTWIGGQVGSLYHEIVAAYRTEVASGREPTHHFRDRHVAEARAQRYADDFIDRRRVPSADADQLRGLFVRYITRKASEGDLQRLATERILTEVDLANPKCEFRIGKVARNYPLRGRVDELNVTRRVLIERTLESDPLQPDRPPMYKFWQAWLYQQLIATLADSRCPPALASLWDGEMEVVVETPDRDFPVKVDESFTDVVARAYYWIREIFRGVSFAAVDNEAACTRETPYDACSHCHIDCFVPPQAFPARRDEIRRLCCRYARAFLNDRLWGYDLWFYRQCLLPPLILEQDGLRVGGIITDVADERLHVEVSADDARAIQGKREFLAVPSATGNFFVGHRLNLQRPETDIVRQVGRVRLTFCISQRESRLLRDAGNISLLAPPEGEVFLAEQPPGWLQDYDRSRLARLLKVGAQSAATAQRSGVVRALRVMTREVQIVRQPTLFD